MSERAQPGASSDAICREPMMATVLVPTYRRPRDLERCLTALRCQTEPAEEVLVAVREGDHETLQFLQGVASEGMRLRHVTVVEPGVVAAMNKGLEEAREDIVAIIDDDAAPHPDWLARIRRHFESDPTVGGVGGRDYVFCNGEPLNGQARVVGKVQWFGRVIGNHHLGVGSAREVDVLKGVNSSYRRAAIKNVRFETRLRGEGAQSHNELDFCLKIRRLGWRIIYDPLIAVNHYPGVRHDTDRRDSFDASAWANTVHNETLALLGYLRPRKRAIFVAWAIAIGTRAAPGFLQLVRLTLEGDSLAGAKLRASLKGRLEGWHTWRRSRRFLFA